MSSTGTTTHAIELHLSKQSFLHEQVSQADQTRYGCHSWILEELSSLLHVEVTDIDLKTGFVSLGGDSISAIALSEVCKRRGYFLPVSEILSCASINDVLANISVIMKPLVSETRNIDLPPPLTDDLVRTTSESIPMTELQLTLFQGSEKAPGTNVVLFRETCLTDMLPKMRRAWQQVIEAIPIFRTKLEIVDGVGRLTLQEKAGFCWQEVHVYDEAAFNSELEFNPGELDALLSFKVVTLNRGYSSQRYSSITWRVHHALIDGISAQLIYRKVLHALHNQPIDPGTSFLALAQAITKVHDESCDRARDFWIEVHKQHKSADGGLPLPVQASPFVSTSQSHKVGIASVCFQLPLGQLCTVNKQGISLAALYHGAWALVLSLCLDSDSIVFGGVFSGRTLGLPGIHDTIGPVINSLPFHVVVDRKMSASDYLCRIFRRMMDLESMAFSQPQDGFTRNYSSTLAAEIDMPVPPYGDGQKPEFSMTSDVPLNVSFRNDGTLRICYNQSIFCEADVNRLAQLFRAAILTLTPSTGTIETCLNQMVSSEHIEVLRHIGNAVTQETTVISVTDDLVTLFERVVQEYPHIMAIERGDHAFTYNQLDAMAAQIAWKIRPHITPGSVVCVHADGSINWIVAIWGILKAGATYSALDVKLPSNIRNDNFETANARLLLVPYTFQKSTVPETCRLCFSIEELLKCTAIGEWPSRVHSTPAANAYICFTSGSTGKPKGVVCTHAGLVAFQKDLDVRLFAQPGTRIAQTMSPAFDGSIHEIFSALCHGATLVLGDPNNPLQHLRMVDSVLMTPSIARALDPKNYPRLKYVYMVGEILPQYVSDSWATDRILYNMYGPTEATCGATIKRMHPGARVTIGRPNPTTRIYILDRHKQLVPPGIIGEVYLAGVQVSRGYVKRPEETGKSFFMDSIFPRCGEMMYRTGDRGYWNSYGEVELQGRQDRQIKLRGFRVDLNDIEVRLARAIPEASAVAVVLENDVIVAMLQPHSINLDTIKARAANHIPAHCVPRIFRAVEVLPTTSIGKVDYKAIGEFIRTSVNDRPIKRRVVASGSLDLVAAIWRDVLRLPAQTNLTPTSCFLDLGGHSVAQMLVTSKLKSLLKKNVSLKAVMQSTTLEDLANVVDKCNAYHRHKSCMPLPSLGDLYNASPSPMEREWFEKYETGTGTSAFNVSFACLLDPAEVDVERLAAAWNQVLSRHILLRCRYVVDPKKGLERLSNYTAPRVARVGQLDIDEEVNRPFLLSKEAPIRITISEKYLVASISHIICDLTTLEVINREVMSIYSGADRLPLPRPFESTTIWQKQAAPSDITFWKAKLEGVIQSPPRIAYRNGTSRMSKLPSTSYHQICDFVKVNPITMHQLALASVALALHAHKTAIDIVLGAPFLNRGSEDMETVGLFLEPLPIRIQYNSATSTSSPQDFLGVVRCASQEALAHAIPWHQLLENYGRSSPYPSHPISEYMVTFHDNRGSMGAQLKGVKPLLTWTQGAKFGLMIEFCALTDDTCLLRIEFDTDLYSPNKIAAIERQTIKALECIVKGHTLEDTRNFIQEAGMEDIAEDGPGLFGIALEEL